MTILSTLKADIIDYTAKPDLSDANTDTFVRIATSMVNRAIRHWSQVETVPLTLAPETTLPAGFLEPISLSVDKGVLDYLPSENLRQSVAFQGSRWRNGGQNPYTIEGDKIILAVDVPSDTPATLVYYKRYAELSQSNNTNFILQNHYDLYLYAALSAAYDYLEDEQQEAKYSGKFLAMAVEVNREGRVGMLGRGKRRTGTSSP